jgi:metal-responsive CopG/Arc/MetJ family transcriptional regulator
MIGLRLSPEITQSLDRLAKKAGNVSRSEAIRRILIEYLDRRNDLPKR